MTDSNLHSMRDGFVATWRSFFGKPDGHWPRLHCFLRGHRWLLCVEECCGANCEWCERCLTNRKPAPITGRDKAWSP